MLNLTDAVRAHALVAPYFVGQCTRYNNKRLDHRMIKWVVPYGARLKRARAALKRNKIPFEVHNNIHGEAVGISIRVPLDFVAPADPHVDAKISLAEALATVVVLAQRTPLNNQELAAVKLVAAHVKGLKKVK